MKFLDNLFHHHSQASFSSISGYDGVKNIINRVLSSEKNFNLLLVGPPASSKTQFLMEIMKARNSKTVYFDATNTTANMPHMRTAKAYGHRLATCKEFTASMIYAAIEIIAPINAPLISIKVNAASTVAFSTDSKLTIVTYPYFQFIPMC